MSLWRELFDVASHPDDTPDLPDPPPDGQVRLHLFAGNFGSEEDALAYCYDTPDENHPEPLTRDLPGAYIDTSYVEVAHGASLVQTLANYLSADAVEELRSALAEAAGDTIVLISEAAFGGFPYALSDTPRLAYLGPFMIDAAPAGSALGETRDPGAA